MDLLISSPPPAPDEIINYRKKKLFSEFRSTIKLGIVSHLC